MTRPDSSSNFDEELVRPEMTVAEVAVRMQVSDDHVYSLLRRNELAGVRIARKWRITESDYQAFLESRRSHVIQTKDVAGLSKRSRQRLQRGLI